MTYFISFLEGIITFVSPCLLPMMPIYVSYFAGGGQRSDKNTLTNAIGFVIGFTAVFVTMGALAGTLGSFLIKHQTALNIISGIIVILFGLNYLGVFKLNLFKGTNFSTDTSNLGFVSSIVFGVIFSVGWTPCVGTFLGSALMLASQQAHAVQGIVMLLCYSAGLGIPFVLSAVLVDRFKTAFDFIKKNYDTINKISGILLVAIGVAMATGMLGKLLGILS
ncbi:MAG: cytochrome c biogenesis protein CcdA [Oscillospiraceae bacterium]|nr:cytochrome c biogenesis protein CcdA [Oscillospiraceae bacterium]